MVTLFKSYKSIPIHCVKFRQYRNEQQRKWKLPKIRQWQPTPVLLPRKSHGQRSLGGYSPWGHEESDTTERLHFHFSLSFIGEGNGNPLQCSCLENPRDRGAWWAAINGVAQSRTWLKWLSSSSSNEKLLLTFQDFLPHFSFIRMWSVCVWFCLHVACAVSCMSLLCCTLSV